MCDLILSIHVLRFPGYSSECWLLKASPAVCHHKGPPCIYHICMHYDEQKHAKLRQGKPHTESDVTGGCFDLLEHNTRLGAKANRGFLSNLVYIHNFGTFYHCICYSNVWLYSIIHYLNAKVFMSILPYIKYYCWNMK